MVRYGQVTNHKGHYNTIQKKDYNADTEQHIETVQLPVQQFTGHIPAIQHSTLEKYCTLYSAAQQFIATTP